MKNNFPKPILAGVSPKLAFPFGTMKVDDGTWCHLYDVTNYVNAYLKWCCHYVWDDIGIVPDDVGVDKSYVIMPLEPKSSYHYLDCRCLRRTKRIDIASDEFYEGQIVATRDYVVAFGGYLDEWNGFKCETSLYPDVEVQIWGEDHWYTGKYRGCGVFQVSYTSQERYRTLKKGALSLDFAFDTMDDVFAKLEE